MSNTSDMKDTLNGIPKDNINLVDEAKALISILDSAKEPYFNATRNLDEAVHDLITPVNDTLYAVRDAYQERIDVQNCRSDLFWRVTGITTADIGGVPGAGVQTSFTVTCTKLSTTYSKSAGITSEAFDSNEDEGVGFGTNVVVKWDGLQSFTQFPMNSQGDSLISDGSGLDAFYEPDNLHGIKLYDEPYARDVFDTFRSVGVGTIGLGTDASTNHMTILAPNSTMDIEVGYLMKPSISGFFASQFVTVTGVGTTAVGLSTYPFSGITTTADIVCPYITVDQLPVGIISAPTLSGDYVEMVFSQDPDTISDSFALTQESQPYTPQTIEIMERSRAGNGVEVRYDNSGISSGTRSWNKFLDGFPDPDDLDVTVSEPRLGADKVYYTIGFPEQPVIGGTPATEGQTFTLNDVGTGIPSVPGYTALSSCDDTAVNAAISARNTAESNLASNADLQGMIQMSNDVKKKLSDEFNLRIWAYRMQIGESNNRLASFRSFEDLVDNSPYGDIMNR